MAISVQRSQQQRVIFLLLGLFMTLVTNATWASDLPVSVIGDAIAQEAEVSNTTTRHLQTYTKTGFQSLLLDAVNKERAALGLSAFCTSTKLQSSAQKHSDDMAARNFISHIGSDGSTMSQRITTAGFQWTSIAENVAAGQKDVVAVVKTWMNSAGRKKNLLSTKFTCMGTGYAYSSSSTYKHYWTQDFGAGSDASCLPFGSSIPTYTTAPATTKAPAATTKPPATTTKPSAVITNAPATIGTPLGTVKPPSTSPSNTIHTEMLAAVNKQRAAMGLSSLCINSKLNSAAQKHSDDMASKDYMSHTGSDGSSMSDRIAETGYVWSNIAENVAAGQVDVASVMTAWMSSPGHKSNILGSKMTMIGIAYAYSAGSTYKHYWTQNFGASSTESCSS